MSTLDVTFNRGVIARAAEDNDVLVWADDDVRFLDPYRLADEDGRLLAFRDGECFEVICRARELEAILPATLQTVQAIICADPGDVDVDWFNDAVHAIIVDGMVIGPLAGHARTTGNGATIRFDGCVWTMTAPHLARLIRRAG